MPTENEYKKAHKNKTKKPFLLLKMSIKQNVAGNHDFVYLLI